MWNPQRVIREGEDKEISTHQIPERESLQRFPTTAQTCLGLQEDLNDLLDTILRFSLFHAVDLGGPKCNLLSRGFGIFLSSTCHLKVWGYSGFVLNVMLCFVCFSLLCLRDTTFRTWIFPLNVASKNIELNHAEIEWSGMKLEAMSLCLLGFTAGRHWIPPLRLGLSISGSCSRVSGKLEREMDRRFVAASVGAAGVGPATVKRDLINLI